MSKLPTKCNRLGITEVNTLLDVLNKLFENIGRFISQLEYANVIASLMYAIHCTKPNIAFVVSKLSRYIHNPNVDKFSSILERYSDASWNTSIIDNWMDIYTKKRCHIISI